MASRRIKLEFHEHGLRCPYSRPHITVYSLVQHIIIRARRTCPNCERLMLIRNGRAFRAPGEAAKRKIARLGMRNVNNAG